MFSVKVEARYDIAGDEFDAQADLDARDALVLAFVPIAEGKVTSHARGSAEAGIWQGASFTIAADSLRAATVAVLEVLEAVSGEEHHLDTANAIITIGPEGTAGAPARP